jgi:2-hydroxychromene-2-carboxylate isomerase
MAHIEYFFITTSTFAYLAGDRLEQIAKKHGATITYKPFDLISVFPQTGGLPLPARHESRQSYRLQELPRIARRAGLPIKLQPAHFATNHAPSSYAIIAAQKAGGGDLGKLVQSILAACFAEDRDIADDAVIRDCLERSGFDPGLVDSGLIVGAETYGANTEEALQRGVFGSPFYIVGAEKFWGQDRLDYLDEHLARLA